MLREAGDFDGGRAGAGAGDWPALLARARGGPPLAGTAGGSALRELYEPLLAPPAGELPLVVGHVGQSLDGFIATDSGDSCYVTGRENIVHLHRMRALFDAVLVGAGTVAADDPRLTTREVEGPNPLRVVLDPQGRLGPDHRVFRDGAARTLRVARRGALAAQASGQARASGEARGVEHLEVGVGDDEGGIDLRELLRALHARGVRRLFVEGGGRTVSAFLRAGLLARLQVTIAPLLIGSGRPAVRLPGSRALADCLRAPHRVFRMGGDVLFELDFTAAAAAADALDATDPGLARIL